MRNWNYYKHSEELLRESVYVNYAYAVLRNFATVDGVVVTNPFSLLMLLGNKNCKKASKSDIELIRGTLQRLLDMKLIELREFS